MANDILQRIKNRRDASKLSIKTHTEFVKEAWINGDTQGLHILLLNYKPLLKSLYYND
jgi:hypothetical protein